MSKRPDFDITHSQDEGLHILHLSGRLDTVTSPAAETQIIEVIEKGDTFIMNLRDLVYISSAGLRLILVFMKRTKKKNARMIFCAPGEHVLKVFEVSNFLEFLEITESIEEAVLKLRT
ncbi:MAG: STAS domain-containing protein [Verrucomicrobia bacterium]|nr:STAS domain-containing protein [Verrucomicrobiota bacterium]